MDFGEVFEPVSRAFWDELSDLEDQNEQSRFKLHWISESNCLEEIKLFIVLEGPKIPQFVRKELLKHYTLLCKVLEANISIYFNSEKCSLICLSEEINSSISGPITELMIEWLEKSEQVITISIQPQASYKSEDLNSNSVVFLRGINSKLKNVEELKTPNFIGGISAGVSNWRYFKQLPVSSYILYTCLIGFDETLAENILQLFELIGLPFQEKYSYKHSLSELYT